MRAIILRIFAVAGLTLATEAWAQAQTWDCGETPGTVTATLSGGTLTISGSGAMAGNPWSGYKSSITRVVIEYGVTSIGNGAFGECSGLTSVTIPNSVTYIGSMAFMACSSLTSVTIPASVDSIGWQAFRDCPNLASVRCLGEVPPHAGEYAFLGSRNICLLVPETGIRAYYSADIWKNFSCIQAWKTQSWDCGVTPGTVTAALSDDGTLTISGAGAMANYTESNVPWYGFRGFITSVVIEDGVTSICGSAFSGCTGLKSVTIPNSVTSIGGSAFSGCTGLTSVTIPNSVTSIGYNAFSGCWSLTSVEIPNSVTSIGSSAFAGSGLTSVTIPNSVTSIESWVFSGCTGLTSITIPNSVTSIGDMAFDDCIGLTSVTIPNSVTSIGSSAFRGSGLTSVTIPSSVTSIGVQVFMACSSLTSVTIPNSVDTIGHGAFRDCRSLTSVEIPNSVTSIGDMAFDDCIGLTSVTIPNSVRSIGQQAFMACSSLTSVTIPASVDSIGNNAFLYCTGLTSVTIPNSVRSIGSGAFSGCTGLTNIEVGTGNTAYTSVDGVLFNKDKTTLYQYPASKQGATYSIPNSVDSILSSAFSGCSGLKEVTIPNGVTYIGGGAFSGCSGLTSVTIPNGVTDILNYAFSGCSSLKKVTIPNSVTDIWSGAFSGCSSLTSVTILRINPPVTNDYAFDGTTSRYVPPSACLYIPDTAYSAYISHYIYNKFDCIEAIDDALIKRITFDLRYGSKTITQYALSGDRVVPVFPYPTRDEYVFGGWYKDSEYTELWDFRTGLVSDITLYAKWYSADKAQTWDCGAVPGTVMALLMFEDSTLTISGSGAMADYRRLITQTYPYTSYFTNAPWQYRGLIIKKLVIENGVTSIGNGAFYACSSLTSVTIPNSVTSIGSEAFYGWRSLTSVTIPNSVTSIGGSAFAGCYGLTSVTIGDGVTSIGGFRNSYSPNWGSYSYSPFSEFSNLTSITVSDGNPQFSSVDGVLFNKAQDTLLVYPRSKQGYTISNSVAYIADSAFFRAANLINIISLSETPPGIDTNTFFDVSSSVCLLVPESGIEAYRTADTWKNFSCIQALDVLSQTWDCGVIPETVTATLSDGGTKLTVSGTGAMENYNISTNVAPWSAFRKLITDVVINDSVTSIGRYAFYNCGALTSVTIGDSVTSIGNSAFSGCVNLTSAIIPYSVDSISDSTFYNCGGLTSVTIGDKVSSIGRSAFSGCASLDSVTIPNSVDSIRENAFYGCTGLTSLTIGNRVTSIGNSAFSGCNSLTSVIIPNSVKLIGRSAFYNCDALTSVTIGNGVTSIADSTFYGCVGLTSLTIGNGLISMGDFNFSDYTHLANIDVGNNNTVYSSLYGVLFNKNKTALLRYPASKSGETYTIPDDVASIGYEAFYNVSALTSVTIPNSVTVIGENAFSGCGGLTSVRIPNNVAAIGDSTFIGCVGLTSVRIPNSVAAIGKDAFYGCTGLDTIINLRVNPPGIDADAFRDVPVSSVCLYVPYIAVSNYNSIDVWKDFTCIKPVSGALEITFNPQGGSAVTSQYVFSGDRITTPPDPIRPDSIFSGWYRDAKRAVLWDFYTDIVNSDTTLYARYISKKYVPAADVPKANATMMKEGTAVSANPLAGEFTAGPNPVRRGGNPPPAVSFYRQGKQITSCELRIYNAYGNIINKVKISDMPIYNQLRRKVGSWDLCDKNGRIVSEGTYLVKGAVKTVDGKKEKVSLIIAVR